MKARRNVYIMAGPNGTGKTTFAREFLPNYANIRLAGEKLGWAPKVKLHEGLLKTVDYFRRTLK